MAKFEANIPSYLKSGAGSVPIDDTFQKIGSQPENLSAVIDNYSRNFSGSIQYPDGESMAGPIKPIPGQQTLPLDIPTDTEIELDDELPKLLQRSVSNKPMEPEIPADSDIKDILIA